MRSQERLEATTMRTAARMVVCAWVLWQQQGVVDPVGTVGWWGWSWVIGEAVATEQDCRRLLHARDAGRAKDAAGYFAQAFEGRTFRVRELCLPDTIDPRK
jgi:hypothetical protein